MVSVKIIYKLAASSNCSLATVDLQQHTILRVKIEDDIGPAGKQFGYFSYYRYEKLLSATYEHPRPIINHYLQHDILTQDQRLISTTFLNIDKVHHCTASCNQDNK